MGLKIIIAVLCLGFFVMLCGKRGAKELVPGENVQKEALSANGSDPVKTGVQVLNDRNFDGMVLTAEGVYLVDFYADWCPPCRKQGPIIEEVAQKYGDAIGVGKVDVDKNRVISWK